MPRNRCCCLLPRLLCRPQDRLRCIEGSEPSSTSCYPKFLLKTYLMTEIIVSHVCTVNPLLRSTLHKGAPSPFSSLCLKPRAADRNSQPLLSKSISCSSCQGQSGFCLKKGEISFSARSTLRKTDRASCWSRESLLVQTPP